MKKLLVVLALVLVWVAKSPAPKKTSLRLVQTVSLAVCSVIGTISAWDVKSNRLFLTSEDEPVVDVFDLKTNKLIHTITGIKGSHNVLAFQS